MKTKSIATLILALLATFLQAADKPIYTYEGEVAGVMCSACSNRVKGALSTIEGVKSVKITLPKSGGLPQIVVVSSSPSLTKEAAVKALGADAKMYDIRSLKLKGKP